MNMKSRLLRVFIIYTLDMAAAVVGWIYGFGMTVHNWYALIGILIVWRFVFHILGAAAMAHDAKAIGTIGGEHKEGPTA